MSYIAGIDRDWTLRILRGCMLPLNQRPLYDYFVSALNLFERANEKAMRELSALHEDLAYWKRLGSASGFYRTYARWVHGGYYRFGAECISTFRRFRANQGITLTLILTLTLTLANPNPRPNPN